MKKDPSYLLKGKKLTLKSLLPVIIFALLAGLVLILLSRAESNILGDANGDSKVDLIDLSIVLSNFGKSNMTYAQGDLDNSTKVDLTDLSIVLSHYGKSDVKPPAFPTVTPKSASSLRDMIGINTRTAYNDTNYECWGGSDAATECQTVIDKIKWLGVDHIRDGLNWNHPTQGKFYDSLLQTGIKLTLNPSDLFGGRPYINRIMNEVLANTAHGANLRNLVTAYESVNEPDNYSQWPMCMDSADNDSWYDETTAANDGKADSADPECAMTDMSESQQLHQATGSQPCNDGIDNDGDGKADRADLQCRSNDEDEKLPGMQTKPNWADRTRLYTQKLYERVNSAPSEQNKPVIGPSWVSSTDLAKAGDMSPYVDFGNFHPYPGSDTNPPGELFDINHQRCHDLYRGKPCATTEVGLHTYRPFGGANEHVQAAYSLRFLLDAYSRGLKQNFDFYNLVEQYPDSPPCTADSNGFDTADYGWFDCTWKPNQVATMMHNFTQTFGDGAPTLTPLAYRQDQAPADMRKLVFRQDTGRYVIVLWRNVSMWNGTTDTEVSVRPETVKLTMPNAQAVNLVLPLLSANQTPLALSGGQVTTSVGGDPVMLVVQSL